MDSKVQKLCARCGEVDLSSRDYRTRFCQGCQMQRFTDNGGSLAHNAVSAAVARGSLPAAKTQVCVDCGAQARDYDHRDYSKLLDVQPVCRSCNRLRGPALFNFSDEQVKARYFAGA